LWRRTRDEVSMIMNIRDVSKNLALRKDQMGNFEMELGSIEYGKWATEEILASR
jgi:hypothetical protein